jgi:alpha(1,3/1,4) fucosyltransferase
MSPDHVAVFVDPLTHHYERNRLFDVEATSASDNAAEPFAYLHRFLEEQGLSTNTADYLGSPELERDVNVYISLGMRHRYRSLANRQDVILSGFFALECPVVEPRLYRELAPASHYFKRVFSYSPEEALRPFLTGPVDLNPFRLPQFFEDVHQGLWDRRDRKFLVMINANKLPRVYLNELYTERLRAIEYFERYGEIDLFGFGWSGPPMRVGETWVPGSVRKLMFDGKTRWQSWRPPRDPISTAVRRAYRGPVVSKAETLSQFTFSICFENSMLEGWVTEKMFDCFFAGTVPVYLGDPVIERWVPSECYIDMRRFDDFEELRAFLHSLGPQEIDDYRTAAREYLRSDQYRPFTKYAFAELIASLIEEDTGVPLDLEPLAAR